MVRVQATGVIPGGCLGIHPKGLGKHRSAETGAALHDRATDLGAQRSPPCTFGACARAAVGQEFLRCS